jgi:outer membrane immunogenic protein
MNKTVLGALAVTVLMANYAYAADLPVRPAPPPPAPVATWTGCYLGGNVGWARVETKLLFNNVDDFSRSADGIAGGGQIGCDYQFASNWVFGVQAMFDGTNIGVSRVSRLFPTQTIHADVNWFGTVTARLGYAFSPSFLLYSKVGWGTYETEVTLVNNATGAELSGGGKNRSGLDVGVGGEWMFTPNLSLFVEWDHIFVKDQGIFFANLGAGGTPAEIRRDFDKVLVGFNWRFGGYGSQVRGGY